MISLVPSDLQKDGKLFFGRGDPAGQTLVKHNPGYCNLKLAVARVMNACGAADIIAQMYGDDDGVDDEKASSLSRFIWVDR